MFLAAPSVQFNSIDIEFHGGSAIGEVTEPYALGDMHGGWMPISSNKVGIKISV
jgi:hypothetical protein